MKRPTRKRAQAKASTNGKHPHGFPVVDADSHVLEPPEIWTKYLDRSARAQARVSFWLEPGEPGLGPLVVLNGRPAKPMNTSRVNRQAIWRPGMTPDAIGALDPKVDHPPNPGASDPKARLRDMDALGVDRAVLFPTLFAEYFPLVEAPTIAGDLARAYNDWIWDFARKAPKRLVPVAVLPLQDPSLALRELRRAAKRGFRAAFLRPSFVGARTGSHGIADSEGQARYLNHADFDPLWRELEALEIAACVHPSPGSTNPEWTSMGSFVERVAQNLRPGHYVAESVAPTMDNATFLTSILFYAHLERFPKLRLAMHHSGASWVTLALEKAETYLWLLSNFKDVSLEPEHVFAARRILVTFASWESSVARQPETFAGFAAWGSRYPHHDATGPDEALDLLRRWKTPDHVVARYMGGNAAAHFGLAA